MTDEHAVRDRDAGVRLNDVDVVRRDLDAIAGIDDGHRRVWLQQIGEMAGVRGIQVLDDDQREPRPGRQRGEELRQRAQPPGRGTDPDDGEWVFGRRSHVASLGEYSRAKPSVRCDSSALELTSRAEI